MAAGWRLYLALGVGVFLAAAVAYVAYFHVGGVPEAGIEFPRSLPGGYTVVRVVAGEEAASLVAGIHWSPERIPVVDAVVVEYGDGTRLWAVRVSGDACSVAERMAEKMRMYEQRLPYTAPVPHEIGGVTVYLSMDKRTGGLHAFWCRDGIVAWAELGASGVEGLRVLMEETG